MSKIYIGDIGTAIKVDTGSDLATATTTNIQIKKPDDSVEIWVGAVVEDTVIQYTSTVDTFDQIGNYEGQAVVVLPSWDGLGETFTFKVYGEFK